MKSEKVSRNKISDKTFYNHSGVEPEECPEDRSHLVVLGGFDGSTGKGILSCLEVVHLSDA